MSATNLSVFWPVILGLCSTKIDALGRVLLFSVLLQPWMEGKVLLLVPLLLVLVLPRDTHRTHRCNAEKSSTVQLTCRACIIDLQGHSSSTP
jgi:hypothetical protein